MNHLCDPLIVETDTGVTGQPSIMFRLVNVQIVQKDMQSWSADSASVRSLHPIANEHSVTPVLKYRSRLQIKGFRKIAHHPFG